VIYVRENFSLVHEKDICAFVVGLYNFASTCVQNREITGLLTGQIIAHSKNINDSQYPRRPSKRKRTQDRKEDSQRTSAKGSSGKQYDDEVLRAVKSLGYFPSALGSQVSPAIIFSRLPRSECLKQRGELLTAVGSSGDREVKVKVKVVPAVHGLEVTIHKMLADVRHRSNIVIPLLQTVHLDGKTLLFTPFELPFSKICFEEVKDRVSDLSRQLFAGVGFIHHKGVAHLDLKPDNLVITRAEFQLRIIDFGISRFTRHRSETLRGFRGTTPWVAPEVGEENGPDRTFSPIEADLWATGNIVLHISETLNLSVEEGVLKLASLLRSNQPSLRPSLDQNGAASVINPKRNHRPSAQSPPGFSPSLKRFRISTAHTDDKPRRMSRVKETA